jgi:hypothetical protein
MKVQAQRVNSFLGVFNFLLLTAIVGMLAYMFYENKRRERGMVFVKEGAELKMYVVEDNVFNGYLKNKLVRVMSLSPLYLEILPQNVQVEKNGKWDKEIYDGSAKVKNIQEPFIYIKGKRSQDSEN